MQEGAGSGGVRISQRVSHDLGWVWPAFRPFRKRTLSSPQAMLEAGGKGVFPVALWRSPVQRPWMSGSVPRDAVTGGSCLDSCLPYWIAHGALSPAVLGRDLFSQDWNFLPQGMSFRCFRFCTTHLSGAPHTVGSASEAATEDAVINRMSCNQHLALALTARPFGPIAGYSGSHRALLLLQVLG